MDAVGADRGDQVGAVVEDQRDAKALAHAGEPSARRDHVGVVGVLAAKLDDPDAAA